MSWPPTAAHSEDKRLAHRSLSCYTALMSHHLLIHCHYPKSNTWKQETKEASLNLRNAFTCWFTTVTPLLTEQHQLDPARVSRSSGIMGVRYTVPLCVPKLCPTLTAFLQHCSQAWTGCCEYSWKLLPVRHKTINGIVCSAVLLTVLGFVKGELFKQS